jgi:hypothetical protein
MYFPSASTNVKSVIVFSSITSPWYYAADITGAPSVVSYVYTGYVWYSWSGDTTDNVFALYMVNDIYGGVGSSYVMNATTRMLTLTTGETYDFAGTATSGGWSGCVVIITGRGKTTLYSYGNSFNTPWFRVPKPLWTGGSELELISTIGVSGVAPRNQIVWNGTMWLSNYSPTASGPGSATTRLLCYCIPTNNAPIDWELCNVYTQQAYAYRVFAWNGSIWVIGGCSFSAGTIIYYSFDGINVYPGVSAGTAANDGIIGSHYIVDLIWTGDLWLCTALWGGGGDNGKVGRNIGRSYDGINWITDSTPDATQAFIQNPTGTVSQQQAGLTSRAVLPYLPIIQAQAYSPGTQTDWPSLMIPSTIPMALDMIAAFIRNYETYVQNTGLWTI